jgi:hypothetical protein
MVRFRARKDGRTYPIIGKSRSETVQKVLKFLRENPNAGLDMDVEPNEEVQTFKDDNGKWVNQTVDKRTGEIIIKFVSDNPTRKHVSRE